MPVATPEPLVALNLSKRYGRGRPVIEGFSETFLPGTATGLVGPNGAGKSTLLRMLMALSYPTSGSVRFGSIDIHAHPHRYLAQVGVVHDEPDLPGHVSAEELIEWILRERGKWSDEGRRRGAIILDRLALDERRQNLIGTYSSGMARKAQIAAALTHEPGVILLDEPFNGLDAASLDAAVDILADAKARGAILILSSHLAEPIAALCEHTIRMGEG
jgi:ABC-2 type transport system ATP-binding protein